MAAAPVVATTASAPPPSLAPAQGAAAGAPPEAAEAPEAPGRAAAEDVLRSELQLGLMCFPVSARPLSHSAGEDAARLVGRFQALRQLQHPNLCRYLDVLVGTDHLVFVAAEHASKTLADLLALRPQGLDEPLVLCAVRNMVDALCHLNAHGLVHGHLESEQVLVAEDGRFKLTGHGLGHLVWHGRLADFPLRPRGCYLAPELADDEGGLESSAARPSCKPDVWSLGALALELAHGPWRPEGLGPGGDEGLLLQATAVLETACSLRRFADSAVRNQGGLSAVVLLGGAAPLGAAGAEAPTADGLALPLPSVRPLDGEPAARELEDSYRQWLSGSASPRGGQDLRDLWSSCLTAHPSFRPLPADLVSHPAVAGAPSEFLQQPGPGGLRWSDCPALRSERLLQQSPEEACAEAATPLRYLKSFSAEVEHLFYWWHLAGGDPFAVLAERRLLRPMPPAFRLPLYVRDSGADDERGVAASFLSLQAEEESPTGQPRGLWGPPGLLRPRTVGVDLRGLCSAVAGAEKVGLSDFKSIRPLSLYDRQHHFSYQWLRVRHFQPLLLSMPGSRPEVFREAADDIPPLLRSQAWAAILGADCESDRGCWTPFYEQLLASPLEASSEDRRHAMQSPVSHELVSHPEGRRRLERLVHAVLKANSSLTRTDGLALVAAPFVAVYPDNEPGAFLAMQRLLHGFLWHLYSQEAAMHRRQCMHLFSALLGFADPQLGLHLNSIGMQPDLYANDWFHTWFAALLPLHQTLLLWDALLLRPPQFSLFVGVCLMHSFRRSLLAMDEASQISSFLASCAQLADVAVLVQAALALFQAVPASVTLPVYPRHSAGEALLSRPGSAAVAAVDPEWIEVPGLPGPSSEADPGSDPHLAAAREHLTQRATEQWRQSEWWRRRAASALTAPVITVDDLLSFRSRCFVLDVRSHEEFAAGHFQASSHVRDPEDGDLSHIVPSEVLNQGGTPKSPADPQSGESEESLEAASPWLFAFDPTEAAPELRVRLVVVVGAGARGDFGAGFAERLICVGVRQVVCLLGGAGALRADAPRYLVAGPE